MQKKFEIFISFKNYIPGKESVFTEDRKTAENIYKFLHGKGYEVFFSPVSCQGEATSDFQMLIENALEQSRVLILVTSSKEYCYALHVKREWTTFLGLMDNGFKPEGKIFSVLVGGAGIKELPPYLRALQFFEDKNEKYLEEIDAFVRKKESISVSVPEILREKEKSLQIFLCGQNEQAFSMAGALQERLTAEGTEVFCCTAQNADPKKCMDKLRDSSLAVFLVDRNFAVYYSARTLFHIANSEKKRENAIEVLFYVTEECEEVDQFLKEYPQIRVVDGTSGDKQEGAKNLTEAIWQYLS